MTALYLDSSALVKLYLAEASVERGFVLKALDDSEGRVVSSAITYAEVTSAIARYFHENRIDEAEYQRDIEIFQNDWASINIVDVLPDLSLRAGQLLKAQRGLRAMDALHLASAMAVRAGEEIRFLTFDTQLQTVAQKLMPDAF